MAMNISCKFAKASYNIFFVRAVTVKSLYTLRWRRRNEVKSIVYNNLFITRNTFWANELDNSTDLPELKHTYVILLMHHLFQSFLPKK